MINCFQYVVEMSSQRLRMRMHCALLCISLCRLCRPDVSDVHQSSGDEAQTDAVCVRRWLRGSCTRSLVFHCSVSSLPSCASKKLKHIQRKSLHSGFSTYEQSVHTCSNLSCDLRDRHNSAATAGTHLWPSLYLYGSCRAERKKTEHKATLLKMECGAKPRRAACYDFMWRITGN